MTELQSMRMNKNAGRSIGLKLMVICGLAVLMTIPALFIGSLVEERSRRAMDVVDEISRSVGGPQTFLGPTLVIPYEIPKRSTAQPAIHGLYFVFPFRASTNLKTVTTERHRSLFRVPVYHASLQLHSSFDLQGVPAAAPPNASLDWNRAELVVGVSNPRGALMDGTSLTNGKRGNLAPAESASDVSFGCDEKERIKLILLGTKAGEFAKPGASFQTSASLEFSGAQRVALLSYGKTTLLTAQGDWRNPGFDSGIAPITRNVSTSGFNANWLVPFVARGVRAEGTLDTLSALNNTALGISFIEVANAYQSVDRSLKYVLLIVGLIFLSYFAFEVSTGKRVHPAQYILVGMAQMIFYLLLLSLTERVGFDFGFWLAAIATLTLLSVNAEWVFSERKQTLKAFLMLTVLYTLIYLLLRLQDNALLVGAISSFLAVAAVMYLTRELDWYSGASAFGGAIRGLLDESQTEPTANAK